MLRKLSGGGCKLLLFIGMLLLLSEFTVKTAWAGSWRQDTQNNWYYENEDGSRKKNEWLQEKNGDRYYLDEDGRMLSGFHTFPDGTTYFFGSGGHMERGLVKINGLCYYFDPSGRMVTGSVNLDGKERIFSKEGLADSDLYVISGKIYYYNEAEDIYEAGKSFQDKKNQKGNWNLPVIFMAVFAAFLYITGKGKKDGCERLILFLMILFASTPLYLPYLFRGHDSEFHWNRILGLAASLKQGMFPVRLNAFTFEGFGYADPVFYPSLFLYVPAFFVMVGMPFVDAVNLWLILLNILTAGVMYYSASRMFRSKEIGWISSIFYTLGIYRLGNIYTRAAFGELLAMIFIPLIVYGFYELFFGNEKKWWVLVIGFTGVFQSHLISVLFVAAGCIIAGLICVKRILEKKRIAALAKIMVMTVLLNLWFLVPLLDYMGAGINLEALQFQAADFLVAFPKLLEIFPKSMGATPLTFTGTSGCMALGFGLPILAGIVLSVYQKTQKTDAGDRRADSLLITGVVLALCTTELFPWKMLMQTELFGKIGSFIQFPWRLLNLSLCFLSMACACAVCRQWSKKVFHSVAFGVLLVCVLTSQHFLEDYFTARDSIWRTQDINSMISQEEYLYKEVDKTKVWEELPGSESVTVLDSRKDGLSVTVQYESESVGEQAYVDMPLFYYPIYQAFDQNGNRIPVIKTEDGLARVLFTAEAEGTISILYKERRLWRLCELISAGTAAGCAAFAYNRRKKNQGKEEKHETDINIGSSL